MAKMGRYCKAYLLGTLREFSGWNDKRQSALVDGRTDGKGAEGTGEVTDSDILYLQENFVVTDGIFIDEGIVFDQVTPEWIEFCKNDLKFEVPTDDAAASTSAA